MTTAKRSSGATCPAGPKPNPPFTCGRTLPRSWDTGAAITACSSRSRTRLTCIPCNLPAVGTATWSETGNGSSASSAFSNRKGTGVRTITCSLRWPGTPAPTRSTGRHSTGASMNGKTMDSLPSFVSCAPAIKPPLRLSWWPYGRSCERLLPRYGLGRAELLPLRKGKEAISAYVGKYLAAGLALRRHSWKGCRRVEFDRRAKNTWLVCSRVFSWNTPGAKAWRARVGELGAALGVEDMEGIRRKLGRKWAYWMREKLITLSSAEDWAEMIAIVRYRRVTAPALPDIQASDAIAQTPC